MSLFKTSVPIDIEAIKKLLPKDHTIDGVKFNPADCSVELHWHARYVTTPHTFATEWPLDLLKRKEMPSTAKFVGLKPNISDPLAYAEQAESKPTKRAPRSRVD